MFAIYPHKFIRKNSQTENLKNGEYAAHNSHKNKQENYIFVVPSLSQTSKLPIQTNLMVLPSQMKIGSLAAGI